MIKPYSDQAQVDLYKLNIQRKMEVKHLEVIIIPVFVK